MHSYMYSQRIVERGIMTCRLYGKQWDIHVAKTFYILRDRLACMAPR